MRLIDADALIAKIDYTSADVCADYGDGFCQHGYSTPLLRLMISESTTIDAVPVVRCAECKYNSEDKAIGEDGLWCDYWAIDPDSDDFCCKGERRSE